MVNPNNRAQYHWGGGGVQRTLLSSNHTKISRLVLAICLQLIGLDQIAFEWLVCAVGLGLPFKVIISMERFPDAKITYSKVSSLTCFQSPRDQTLYNGPQLKFTCKAKIVAYYISVETGYVHILKTELRK